MFNSSGVPRASRIWWAGSLSLAVCLGAGIGGLGAQERLPAGPPGFSDAIVALTPTPGDVALRPGDPLDEALAGVEARLDELSPLAGQVRARQDELTALKEQNRQLLARIEVLEGESSRLPDALKVAKELTRASEEANAKVGDLIEELIAERSTNARLETALADAEAERSRIEEMARGKEAAWSAWTSSLRDELAQSEAQLADATAAQARTEARLEEQARIAKAERARAARQLAAMKDQLRERDRELAQVASVRSELEDLRQRLDVAHVELKRNGADNDRLAAELAAARTAATSATALAQQNLAAIDDQITMLHAAAGHGPPGRPEQLAELLATAFPEDLPAMPYPKPRLSTGKVDTWTPGSGEADSQGPRADDLALTRASFVETAASRPEPTAARAPASAPNSPEIVDIMSAAALPPDPFGSDPMAADESPRHLERGSRSGLNQAAARLADGLRTTREEAMFRRQERVFTVDVEERAFAANSAEEFVPLDPALNIDLFTAKSELVGEGKGRIRFFPDGSSTGGRIDLELLGSRAAVNVLWSTGLVTVER